MRHPPAPVRGARTLRSAPRARARRPCRRPSTCSAPRSGPPRGRLCPPPAAPGRPVAAALLLQRLAMRCPSVTMAGSEPCDPSGVLWPLPMVRLGRPAALPYSRTSCAFRAGGGRPCRPARRVDRALLLPVPAHVQNIELSNSMPRHSSAADRAGGALRGGGQRSGAPGQCDPGSASQTTPPRAAGSASPTPSSCTATREAGDAASLRAERTSSACHLQVTDSMGCVILTSLPIGWQPHQMLVIDYACACGRACLSGCNQQ